MDCGTSGCTVLHCLPELVKVFMSHLCLTLCNLMGCSTPGSSIHGTSKGRILEWAATSFSRRSSWPRDFLDPGLLNGRQILYHLSHQGSLLKFMSIELTMPSNYLILCCPLLLLPASESFLVRQLFASSGQSIGASGSASVLPANIQGWYPF